MKRTMESTERNIGVLHRYKIEGLSNRGICSWIYDEDSNIAKNRRSWLLLSNN